MKRYLLNLLTFMLAIVASAQPRGNSAEIAKNYQPKYPYTAAAIVFEVTGDASGSSTLYFDRNGWRSAFYKEITFERYGIRSTESTLELTDGDYIYTVNLESKKGQEKTDKKWSSLIPYKNAIEVNAAILEIKGGKLDRIDTLLGKPCSVWVFEKNTTTALWEHQGIPLKIVKKLPGYSYTLEATSIDPEFISEASVFSLPDSITWKKD